MAVRVPFGAIVSMKVALLGIGLFFLTQTAYATEKMELYQGLMTVGGSVQLPFEFNKNGVYRLDFQLDPEFGYFVYPGLLVTAGLSFSIGPSLYQSNLPAERSWYAIWGGRVGIQYFFDTGTAVFPYVGLKIGTLVNNTTLVTLRWVFEVPIGILWALNKNVAIQFAVPVTLHMATIAPLSALGPIEKITVVPGYVGLLAFF